MTATVTEGAVRGWKNADGTDEKGEQGNAHGERGAPPRPAGEGLLGQKRTRQAFGALN